MTIGSVDPAGQLSLAAIQSMDLETAMMAVQSNRVNLLDTQLKDQIATVQARNNQISKLNQLLGALNKTAAAFPGDAKNDALVLSVPNAAVLCQEVRNATVEAGINDLKMPGGDSNGFGGSVSKGALDGKIQELKSMIDSLSNTQQMDMLRLQSLTNKRNEAYEVMSNFMKKLADSKSGILSTWR